MKNHSRKDHTKKVYVGILKLITIILLFSMVHIDVFAVSIRMSEAAEMQTIESELDNIQQEKEALEIERANFEAHKQSVINEVESAKAKKLEFEEEKANLEAENMDLQNKVKEVANIGPKPRSYRNPEVIKKAVDTSKYPLLGNWRVSFYTAVSDECGNNSGITKSGKPVKSGCTFAIDTRYYQLGTVLYVEGIGYGVCEDSGGGVSGSKRIDINVSSKEFAINMGRPNKNVYLVKRGNGKVTGNELKELGIE